MEKFEIKIHEKKPEDILKSLPKTVKPPENLPVEGVEIDIDMDAEMARARAIEIGLKSGEEIELFVDIVEKGNESFVNSKIDGEGVLDLAIHAIEKTGDFREPMELFEYYGSNPEMFSEERREFKEFAESARYILESKRDAGLLPFDEEEELKKLRKQRKKIVEMVKNGDITKEKGLEISRADFEDFKRERDWQRGGTDYFERTIIEDMMNEMDSAAGISALDARMILENEEELKKYTAKYGSGIVLKLLEVPAGEFDSIEVRSDFVRALDDEIEAQAVFYRFTEEQKDELKNYVLGNLISKRADVAGKIAKGLDKDETLKEITGIKGLNRRKIKIIPTAFAFYIRCGDVKDYAALFNGKAKEDLTKEDIKEADKSRGFYKGENYLAEKSIGGKKTFGARQFGTFVHEEQHFFDQIFQTREAYLELKEYLGHAAAHISQEEIKTGKKDFKKTEHEIGQALRGYRKQFEWRAATEFLAFFQGGREPEQILEILETEKKHGGLYDYFDDEIRGKICKHITENFDSMGQAEANGIIQKVLVHEYIEKIIEARWAMTFLVGARLSKDRIISFLQKIPFDRWLSETRKLLKNRKEKEI